MDIFHGASEVTAVREDITANLQAEAEEERSAVRFFLGSEKMDDAGIGSYMLTHTHIYIIIITYTYIYIHSVCVCLKKPIDSVFVFLRFAIVFSIFW